MQRPSARAFTLIEVLVAIGILVILAGITVKAVSRLRQTAYITETRNQLVIIANAMQDYSFACRGNPAVTSDWRFADNLPASPKYDTRTRFPTGVDYPTAAESLVLALYGGLALHPDGYPRYDPAAVGAGPRSFNKVGTPRRYQPFLTETRWLSWQETSAFGCTGHYFDNDGEANDSAIPEILDRFPQGMPILYIRAAKDPSPVLPLSDRRYNNNGVVGLAGRFNIGDTLPYTEAFLPDHPWPDMKGPEPMPLNPANAPPGKYITIGEGKKIPHGKSYAVLGSPVNVAPPYLYHGLRTIDLNATMTPGSSGYTYPYDAYYYLKDPNADDRPRRGGSYLLISPGVDRIYGTDDDITNFDPVKE